MIPSPSSASSVAPSHLPCVNAESVEIRRREAAHILWPKTDRRRLLESAPPMSDERGVGADEQNILKGRERISLPLSRIWRQYFSLLS